MFVSHSIDMGCLGLKERKKRIEFIRTLFVGDGTGVVTSGDDEAIVLLISSVFFLSVENNEENLMIVCRENLSSLV